MARPHVLDRVEAVSWFILYKNQIHGHAFEFQPIFAIIQDPRLRKWNAEDFTALEV